MKHKEHNMRFLPVTLNITNKEILIVGGGKVAFHKIKLILPFTQNIRIVARSVIQDVKNLGLPYTEKQYEANDLKNSYIVYACTDIKELNEQIYNDAHAKGILVNVVDNPPLCDFVSPAVYKRDHMTVAVGSNAQDVYASIRWRDHIRDFLESNRAIL